MVAACKEHMALLKFTDWVGSLDSLDHKTLFMSPKQTGHDFL